MSSENNKGTLEQMKNKAKDLADKAEAGIDNMKDKLSSDKDQKDSSIQDKY